MSIYIYYYTKKFFKLMGCKKMYKINNAHSILTFILLIINLCILSSCNYVETIPTSIKNTSTPYSTINATLIPTETESFDLIINKTFFQKINNDVTSYFSKFYIENNTYVKRKCDIFGLSSEGGNVEGYFQGNDLKRMKLLLFGELGKYECNYYIIDDDKVYIVLTIYEYDKFFNEKPNVQKEYLEQYFIINNEVMEYNFEKQDLIKSIDNNNILTQFKTAKETLLNS